MSLDPRRMKAIIIIPARYRSSRLPGKPLVHLLGISMLRRTVNRCHQAFPPGCVFVATDDERIQEHCEQAGIQVVMTSADCLTGTDRVAEVAQHIEADIYINVQGDEPVINPDDIMAVYEAALAHPGEIINGMCGVADEGAFRNPSIPKVVARPDGRLLYMSRAGVPTSKNLDFETAYRQICIYSYTKEALKCFSQYGCKTPLEAVEDIEILRFLELGYDVRMVTLSDDSVAVDCPEDIPKAEAAIRSRGLIDAG